MKRKMFLYLVKDYNLKTHQFISFQSMPVCASNDYNGLTLDSNKLQMFCEDYKILSLIQVFPLYVLPH